ncbi:proline-rich nuclear receptor coactivator 1 [Anolis sagrei]|uniref:proline-rich nuclear receptor coactivator 1 n=1 Tax=Anolis sagrei TaxID=38937 RepID=UPI00352095B7
MVTTSAPAAPFLARLPPGAEGALQFPAAFLFQRLLLRGDFSEGPGQARCCPAAGHAGPGGARPALKRVRRRRGKLRAATASGLSQSRFQQYQQHRRSAAQLQQHPSPPAAEDAPAEEASRPAPAPPSKPLRKELLKNRLGKSENQPAHGMHLCEQSKTNRQRNKCNIPVNKVSATKKGENNFWQESVSPELIKKQEKKPLKTTENVKLKKPNFLTEASQKANYAGAKFSDPPSPSVLPKPPSHWVGSNAEYSDQNKEMMAVHLKTLLKVQA